MSISKQTWQELFSLAIQLKQLAPWQWMFDSDFFGIRHPKTGIIYYCTVMGQGEDVYGVGFYEGTAGLDNLLDLANGEELDPFDTMLTQKCLMINFENQEELMENEAAFMKQMNLNFKGKFSIPTFRDYTPGFFPWMIETEEQAQTFLEFIPQVFQIAERVQENPNCLSKEGDAEGTYYLVRTKNGNTWVDEWVEPVDDESIENEELVVDANEVYLRSNLSRITKNASKTWLLDFGLHDEPVQDKEGQRPYFPYMLLVVDTETNMIVGNDVFTHKEVMEKVQQTMAKICRDNGYIPHKIVVGSDETADTLEKIFDIMEVEVAIDDQLDEWFDELKADLFGEGE